MDIEGYNTSTLTAKVKSMSNLIAGQAVTINQGFGRVTLGEVVSYSADKNKLGCAGNYLVKITGGVNCFNKPAQVGKVANFQASHVSAH